MIGETHLEFYEKLVLKRLIDFLTPPLNRRYCSPFSISMFYCTSFCLSSKSKETDEISDPLLQRVVYECTYVTFNHDFRFGWLDLSSVREARLIEL